MSDIHNIASGVLLGGLLLSMALASFQHMRHVKWEDGTKMPWWVYAGWLGPLAYLGVSLYLADT